MNTSDHIWEWVDQPPDDKLLQVCMHEWKYHLILKGLTLLLNEVEKLHRHTSSLGFHQAFYKEEIDRIKQIIEWDNSHPKQRFGLYEERLSIQTLRYFKAGLLLLVSAEEEKKARHIPARALVSLNEEIEKLKSLSEDPKHLQHLKPVDVFFEIIEHDQATNDIHMNSEQSAQGGKLRVFYCYSHEDSELRKQLSKHLSSLRHQGLTEEWHDREIYPGDNWRQQIDSNLTGAHIVLLLVSSSFIHSEFCFNVELKKAMERQKAKECIVIPVIFRACDWQHTPLESLQALPEDGKAVTSWNNIDEAFANVALGIRKAISGFIPK